MGRWQGWGGALLRRAAVAGVWDGGAGGVGWGAAAASGGGRGLVRLRQRWRGGGGAGSNWRRQWRVCH